MKAYHEELALIYQVLSEVKGGEYSNGDLKYYCDVPEVKQTGELVHKSMASTAMIIITDEHYLYLTLELEGKNRGKPTILFKKRLLKLTKLMVYVGADS